MNWRSPHWHPAHEDGWTHTAENGRASFDMAIEAIRERWEAWTIAGICAFNVEK